ncbi:ThiF family adenylyltransferase [Thermodesulfobacteriota bacterium]
MKYSISISQNDYKRVRRHLLKDRSKEQMAITLCGVNRANDKIMFLVRHVILLPPAAFSHQSSGGLELKQEVQQHILTLANEEGLSQIDWHSHPGESHNIGFSTIDDHHESKLFKYLKRKIPNTHYASVVMNNNALKARVWTGAYTSKEIKEIKVGFDNVLALSKSPRLNNSERFDRQVMAFGEEFQNRLGTLRVGVVGLGGFAILTELISRLGIRDMVLIDNDVVEVSNLNRVLGATLKDAKSEAPKVEVAKRNILAIDPKAKVTALQKSVFEKEASEHLKSCDLIIVATDNHSSRLFLNRFANQYLIPLVHVGVNIDVSKRGKIKDISGEFAIVEPGQGWCLQCAQLINPQLASWELASDFEKANLVSRGYIKDIHSPAVYHLNATIASLACSEIHNLIYPYKKLRKYIAYDALTSELMEIKVKSKKSCLVCSPKGVYGLGDLEPLPDFTNNSLIPSNLPLGNQLIEGDSDESKKEASA